MKRCARCLYPDVKPDLFIDSEGVCSACRAFDKRKTIDWAARKRELEAILETGKNGSGFDCIVPSSGGKDSHWQVLTLIEMGVRPLVVTATTCHLTEMGRANIDNLKRYAKTIEVTPSPKMRAKLNRIGLKMVGDISWPEHVTIFTTPFRVASDLGIPLIFYGECPQEAYGGPPGTDLAREMTRRWVQEFGGMNGLRVSDCVGMEGITERDMADYRMPPQTNATAYFLGQFFEWNSRRNAEVAVKAGMKTMLPSPMNWWDFENLDNAQTGIHDHFCWLKYGFGRATAQLSVDIRQGYIGRDEADLIRRERDHVLPDPYMGVPLRKVLSRIGLSRGDLDDLAARFKNRKLLEAAA